MINYLLTHLHILQLEGYSPSRFLSWWLKHPLTYKLSQKKPLVLTPKAKNLIVISLLQLLFLVVVSLFYPPLFLLVLILVLIPFPLLFISLLIISPYEAINREKTINITRQSILDHPNLITIGITGSFGKTSTKDYLYEILDSYKPTLKTPQSYNTVFGISKVVDLELTNNIQYFICEMGAYVPGDIKELCRLAAPQYALLTAIGTQHLERFKSLENTTRTKFELVDAVDPKNALVNLDNEYINRHIKDSQYSKVHTYSLVDPKADFYVNKSKLSASGIDFEITYKKNNYSFHTKLFGTSNLQNLTAAIGLAFLLKVPYPAITKAVGLLEYSQHRLELKKINNSTLIDNAYSSNQTGFTQLLHDLKELPGKKALITPGIVELGRETAKVHQQIGQLSGEVFTEVFLEGHSQRTDNLAIGINSSKHKPKINYLVKPDELWPTINSLSKKYDWILLENDLPDNY